MSWYRNSEAGTSKFQKRAVKQTKQKQHGN